MSKITKSDLEVFCIMLIIIILALAFKSCGTKSKVIDKAEKHKNEVSEIQKKEQEIIKKEKKKEVEKEAISVIDVSELEFNGKKGDSLHIIKKDANGRITGSTVITGSGKFSSKKGRETKRINTREQIETSLNRLKNTKNTTKKQTQESKKNYKKTKDTSFSLWWLIPIIILIIIVAIVYFYLKRLV